MARAIVVAALLGTLLGCASNEPEAEEQSAMSTPSGEATHDLVSTRVFDAPVERVWRAWFEGEEVMRWWGPEGFTDADRNWIDPVDMPGMPPGIPNGVPHVLTFSAVDENTTEMTLTEYGYTTQEAHDQSKAGLEQVLDKLATSLATE